MSTPKIFVKPKKENTLVRNPERGGHLHRDGDWVPNNTFWQRRLNDGDVAKLSEANAKKIMADRVAAAKKAAAEADAKKQAEKE